MCLRKDADASQQRGGIVITVTKSVNDLGWRSVTHFSISPLPPHSFRSGDYTEYR